MRPIAYMALMILVSKVGSADDTFVSIQQVRGNQILIVKDAGGQGRRGGAQMAAKGFRAAGTANQAVTLTVPAEAKITTAMRERRTFEFRVGGELAGGLKHKIFAEMKEPIPARIVTNGKQITEINVITPEIDINQTHTDASGQTVIAIRPKRPPAKKK